MSTRHFIGVVSNGEYKVAQYGHYDGYIKSAGYNFLTFLVDKFDKEKLIKGLENCKFIEGSDDKHGHFRKDPHDLLLEIQNSTKTVELENSIYFASDSVMCEYGYVLDLDKNTFEIFKGVNTNRLNTDERFHDLKLYEDHGEYYQIKHVITYSLDNLPATQEQMLKDFDDTLFLMTGGTV